MDKTTHVITPLDRTAGRNANRVRKGGVMTDQLPTKNQDLGELHSVIELMDCLAQEGFSEIAAIARLALVAMETPTAYKNPEVIARALMAIRAKAEDTENLVNGEAERVGCNYLDDKSSRRMKAWFISREEALHG